MRHFEHRDRYMRRQNRKGDKTFFGIAVLLVGVFLLLKKLDVFYFNIHDIWPIVLIAVGLLIGIKKKFHDHAWWILILVGTVHLVPEFTIMGASSSSLVVPAALIFGGLMIILRPKKKQQQCEPVQTVTTSESHLNIDVTFGGRKEIVTSKDFRGGNITTTFGGVEVNMIQADSTTQPMILNVKVSFGGLELIVPSHWELQNEIDPTLGSVEDSRMLHTGAAPSQEKKILILRGTCSFGSIEIKSY